MNSTTSEEVIERWKEKIKRGFLRVIVLKMFQERQGKDKIILNGNTLREKIKERTGNNWLPSYGSIYPLLKDMEEEGIIEQVESTNLKNKDYRITEFGIELHDRIVSELMVFKNPHDSKHFQEDIKVSLQQKSVKEIKRIYERQKAITNTLAKILQERILSDPKIED